MPLSKIGNIGCCGRWRPFALILMTMMMLTFLWHALWLVFVCVISMNCVKHETKQAHLGWIYPDQCVRNLFNNHHKPFTFFLVYCSETSSGVSHLKLQDSTSTNCFFWSDISALTVADKPSFTLHFLIQVGNFQSWIQFLFFVKLSFEDD